MKKKDIKNKLSLRKSNVVSLTSEQIKGGMYTADCPPFTLGCNPGGTNTCGCPTDDTCLTDVDLSCTPRGCGNTLFNC